MRVISGSLRGLRLAPPSGDRVRPTLDRVKGAAFNIIQFFRAGRPVSGHVRRQRPDGDRGAVPGRGHAWFFRAGRRGLPPSARERRQAPRQGWTRACTRPVWRALRSLRQSRCLTSRISTRPLAAACFWRRWTFSSAAAHKRRRYRRLRGAPRHAVLPQLGLAAKFAATEKISLYVYTRNEE